MRAFWEVINKCQLRDLGYIGSDYTWSRKLWSRGWVRKRLDRALVSLSWVGAFPAARLFYAATSVSDHCILVLKETSYQRKRRHGPKVWSFESMWLEDARCEMVVQGAWDRGRIRNT
nr:hypothetical protein CFP56_48105 [Quercus suber]